MSLTNELSYYRQQIYGSNAIKVEVKSYPHLLVTEVLNPFYIFQIASIILWSFDNYYLYASCIFLVSCLSVGISLFEIRKVCFNFYLIWNLEISSFLWSDKLAFIIIYILKNFNFFNFTIHFLLIFISTNLNIINRYTFIR